MDKEIISTQKTANHKYTIAVSGDEYIAEVICYGYVGSEERETFQTQEDAEQWMKQKQKEERWDGILTRGSSKLPRHDITFRWEFNGYWHRTKVWQNEEIVYDRDRTIWFDFRSFLKWHIYRLLKTGQQYDGVLLEKCGDMVDEFTGRKEWLEA